MPGNFSYEMYEGTKKGTKHSIKPSGGNVTRKNTYDRCLYVATLIEKYLQSNPGAMDSFEGISSWWIARQKLKESAFEVSCALDFLMDKGVVVKVEKDLYKYSLASKE